MRRRKTLKQQARIEWNAIELAQAADQPDEIPLRERLSLQKSPPPAASYPNSQRQESPAGSRTAVLELQFYTRVNPCRTAAITASARVDTPSAVKMAWACCFTVFGAIASSEAMRSLL